MVSPYRVQLPGRQYLDNRAKPSDTHNWMASAWRAVHSTRRKRSNLQAKGVLPSRQLPYVPHCLRASPSVTEIMPSRHPSKVLPDSNKSECFGEILPQFLKIPPRFLKILRQFRAVFRVQAGEVPMAVCSVGRKERERQRGFRCLSLMVAQTVPWFPAFGWGSRQEV